MELTQEGVRYKCLVSTSSGVAFWTPLKGKGKGKGKVPPCTGTEALYRPYGPQGE